MGDCPEEHEAKVDGCEGFHCWNREDTAVLEDYGHLSAGEGNAVQDDGAVERFHVGDVVRLGDSPDVAA